MSAPQGKLRASTTMTSREFNQHTSRAKAAADNGPVVITHRGRPAYVLLSSAEFETLTGTRPFVSVLEAFADPNYSETDVDLMDVIPPRVVEPPRFTFDKE